jgi:hypothetical protein
MGISTTPSSRRRILIALLTATVALIASAYALTPASALAYQEVDPDCMGAICPVAGDGGEPAGDPAGDPSDGSGSGGFEFEHEAPHDNGGGSSSGAQYDQAMGEPAVDPSLFWRAGNPQSDPFPPSDPQSDSPFPNRDRLEREFRQKNAGWARTVRASAISEIWAHDPDGDIWEAHDCDNALDPLRCGVGWVYAVQRRQCHQYYKYTLGDCLALTLPLLHLLQDVIKLADDEWKERPTLGARH